MKKAGATSRLVNNGTAMVRGREKIGGRKGGRERGVEAQKQGGRESGRERGTEGRRKVVGRRKRRGRGEEVEGNAITGGMYCT